MFTGIVEALGEVVEIVAEGPGVRLTINAPHVAQGVAIGDSIAVNGCCLTVVAFTPEFLSFQAGEETLRRTNLGRLQAGGRVNLERSLQLADRLGGHLVTGHIDGLGTVARRDDDGDWCTMWFAAARPLMLQMASKGSIAVDGISLTLVEVLDDRFSVALIPHTLDHTTLGVRQVGDEVNLETDLLAKYVERQLAARQPAGPQGNPDQTP